MAVIGWPDPFDPFGPGSLLVELLQVELQHAHDEGHARDRRRKAAGSRRKAGQSASRSYADNALGAAAELAGAVVLGLLPWQPAPIGPGPDVGRFHVRATRSRDPQLVLRPGDTGPSSWLLVQQAALRYPRQLRLLGVLDLDEQPDPYFWRTPNDRPPAYFIPARCLTPWRDVDPDPSRWFTRVDAFTGEVEHRFDALPRHVEQAARDLARRAGR